MIRTPKIHDAPFRTSGHIDTEDQITFFGYDLDDAIKRFNLGLMRNGEFVRGYCCGQSLERDELVKVAARAAKEGDRTAQMLFAESFRRRAGLRRRG